MHRKPAGRATKLGRWRAAIATALVLSIVAFVVYGYAEDRRDPVVRRIDMSEAGWPSDTRPISILLMSDMHVQGPDMPPERLARIVGELNALHPDIVVLAGDFGASQLLPTRTYDVEAIVRPLAALRPRIGTFAVLGNHDLDEGEETRRALERIGVTVLEDEAVQVGPIALGGFHRHLRATLKKLVAEHGTKILVAHTPDVFPRVPSSVPLTLAGHTHCGQMVLPVFGPLMTGSSFGARYLCGLIAEGRKRLIVSAGLGASRIPLRIGAPPDVWLITLGPPSSGRSAQTH